MRRGVRRRPWHRTLTFRIGVVVLGTLTTFELGRRLLDLLLERYVADGSATGGVALRVALSALLIIVLAVPAIHLLTRGSVGRLRRLADAATESSSASADDLPGPFRVTGSDEIADVASAMNRLRKRVEQSSKTLTAHDIRRVEWIAQVSHDLRTPLTAQAACLERARMMLDRDAPGRQGSGGNSSSRERRKLLDLLSVAIHDGERVHTLAVDLLEIARLDAGDRLHLEPVPPGELVSDAVRELEPLAARSGIELKLSLTSRLPVLHADGRRLMRAIENLLRNAIQHAESVVEVRASLSGESIRFEVRDDGSGLPKEHGFLDYLRRKSQEARLAILAERGSRPDSAGLGLVVAQRVAEAHHGVLDAYNLSRGGASFLIDIPIVAPSRAEDD